MFASIAGNHVDIVSIADSKFQKHTYTHNMMENLQDAQDLAGQGDTQ